MFLDHVCKDQKETKKKRDMGAEKERKEREKKIEDRKDHHRVKGGLDYSLSKIILL